MTMKSLTEVHRRGEVLAYALRLLLELAPTPPCSACSASASGECVMHRRFAAARAALAEWRK
jgi:hypothetical protein